METTTPMKPKDESTTDTKVSQANHLNIACHHCMLNIDATDKAPFSTIPCSTCGTDVVVPMQFGDYLLTEKVGEGAITATYRTFDSVLNRKAIVKILNTKLNADDVKRKHFLNAGKRALDIHSSNVQATYACSEHNGSAFMLTADLPGGNLEKFLELNTTKKLSVEQAMNGLQQLLTATKQLHEKGLRLGKIKPHDILFDDKGKMHLTDIGLADLRPDESASSTEWGTEFYANPEQVLGREAIDESDYYSLGAIFYHLLAGTPPFMGRNRDETLQMRLMAPPKPLHTLNTEVPIPFSDLVMKLLAVFPAERSEVVANLSNIMQTIAAANNPNAANTHRIKVEGGSSVQTPVKQGELPVAKPISEGVKFSKPKPNDQKAKKLGPPKPSVTDKTIRIVVDIALMLFIFFVADYFLNGGDYCPLIGINSPAHNYVTKVAAAKVTSNDEENVNDPTNTVPAQAVKPATTTKEPVPAAPIKEPVPTAQKKVEESNQLTTSEPDTNSENNLGDIVEEVAADDSKDNSTGEIEEVVVSHFNFRAAEAELDLKPIHEEPVLATGRSSEDVEKLLNSTPPVKRPLPTGLDFAAIKTKLKAYINAYKTDPEKRRERSRLNTLSTCKSYLAGLIGHQPYQLSKGVRIKAKGRTYRGRAVLGNINEIILRGKSRHSRLKKFKWKDFKIKQFVTFFDYYMQLLEKQVKMANSREKKERQQDASYHAYRVALLCDWFGLQEQAKRFAMISVRYDSRVKQKIKIMVPYIYEK